MYMETVVGRLMVALDYPDARSAESLLDELKGIPCYMKVGMELFYAAGPAFIERLKRDGYKVFLDLKMHDIPNTVRGGARSITGMGVDMFNVHAAGGVKMMEAALSGVKDAQQAGTAQSDPIVIAVTQLTSTDQRMLNEEIGIPGSVDEAVLRYARLAQQAGMDGVVASAREVRPVKRACGREWLCVTPGIRPAGSQDDQRRVMTPGEAIQAGSDYLVIGRPITRAADPARVFDVILAEMNRARQNLDET